MMKPSKWLIILFCLLFIFSFSLNIFFLYEKREARRVTRVIDGDSFDLSDGRRIRLLGLDAPERGRCMADEARNRLSLLIVEKHVRLTDVVTDDYGRQLANVFVGTTLINHVLVEEGLAKFSGVSKELRALTHTAKDKKRGIYSDTCRGTEPRTDCVIKGNIRSGEKIYHLPICDNYTQVIIDTSFGDVWFCTEEEAQSAGFRKASGCE